MAFKGQGKINSSNRKNVLVTPSQAIKIDDKGPFIYMVIINRKTVVKRIKIDRQIGLPDLLLSKKG